ncbi:hypothetical protein ELY21_14955 [Legionella sp. km535]|uniref:hypothetical protein n=1 Tax=Legionella sp. km535 TaxID=2498107 RepID=UPI000F8E4331|nr:hypothetical protein [Legionella sp. km535]RUR15185.1 hypothetical protein ELY21_14955 [Legionella sp. km535]
MKSNLICPICGVKYQLVFENLKQAENYFNEWYLIDNCIICKLVDQVKEYIRAALLSINCIFYGKYLFTISENDILTKILNNNFRQRRNSIQAIYLELDEINFISGYMLLASYLESSCNAIVTAFHKAHQTDHQVGRAYNLKHNYPKIKKIENLTYTKLLPDRYEESINTQKIRFQKPMHFVWCVNNVLKHQSGIIKDQGSGKKLIDIFKLHKGQNIFDYHLCKIYSVTPKTTVGDLSFLTGMLYVHINDLIAELFNAPKIRIKKLDMEHLYVTTLNIQLKEDTADMLKNSLERDAIIQFVKK